MPGPKVLNNYIVFWSSMFNGKNPSWTTPVHKANMLSFDDKKKAEQFFLKMCLLFAEYRAGNFNGALYRGRIVTNIALSFDPDF